MPHPTSLRPMLLAALLLLGAGCADTPKKPGPDKPGPDEADLGKADPGKKTDGGKAGKEPAYKTTAEALMKEVFADEEAAAKKYEGKVVELEGVVSEANEFLTSSVLLVGAKRASGDESAENVKCVPAEDDREKAWGLGRGQKVRAVGHVNTARRFGVSLAQCRFGELTPSPVIKLTAEQLSGELLKDEGAAKKKYFPGSGRGSEAVISGTVAAVEEKKDGGFSSYRVLLGGEGGVSVVCTISKEAFGSLKKGEKAAIKGDLSSYDKAGKAVYLNTAYILKKS